MARHKTATLALGLVAVCTGVVVVLMALTLGFYIEATPGDIIDSAKGHRIAVPAVVAIIAGVVAIIGRRRGWALILGGVAAAAAVVAVLLTILIPGA